MIDKTLSVIPIDKQLHGLWLFFFTTALLHGLLLTPLSTTWINTIVVCIAMAIVLIKEKLDGKTNSKREHLNDIIAGVVGLIAALVVNYI